MNPPGKTTLFRMQDTAFLEAQRIEISQDARVQSGALKEPMPYQAQLRDDFMGIVRLIDAIMSDKDLRDRVMERMANSPAASAPALVPADAEIEAE